MKRKFRVGMRVRYFDGPGSGAVGTLVAIEEGGDPLDVRFDAGTYYKHSTHRMWVNAIHCEPENVLDKLAWAT